MTPAHAPSRTSGGDAPDAASALGTAAESVPRAGDQAPSATERSWLRRRAGHYIERLNTAGILFAVLLAWASLTPSLLPRGWAIQGVFTGLCLISGYGIGIVVGWILEIAGLTEMVTPMLRRLMRWTIGALTLAIHGRLPPPSSIEPSLPPAFDGWFAKSCAVSPADRFATVKDAARALAEAVGAAPAAVVAVAPVSTGTVDGEARTVSARLPTQLSSTQAVEAADGVPTRSRVPLMIAGLLVVATLVGGVAFLRRSASQPSSTGQQLAAGMVASAAPVAVMQALPAVTEPASTAPARSPNSRWRIFAPSSTPASSATCTWCMRPGRI